MRIIKKADPFVKINDYLGMIDSYYIMINDMKSSLIKMSDTFKEIYPDPESSDISVLVRNIDRYLSRTEDSVYEIEEILRSKDIDFESDYR